VGAVAEAPPATAKETPAAPNTGKLVFARFRLEGCFCAMVEHSFSRRLSVSSERTLILFPAVGLCNPIVVGCSARRQNVLRARDMLPVSRMSSQAVLRLLPLLTAHRTRELEHLRSFAGKERRPSRELLE
jgi:hypothetical protein